MDLDQTLDLLHFYANRHWCDLLVVTDDNGLLAKIESKHCCRVALARLVNNDHVETSRARIKSLGHFAERHDPDRNCTSRHRHFPSGRHPKFCITDSPASLRQLVPHRGIRPQSLLLFVTGLSNQTRPRQLLNELSCHLKEFP